MARAVALLSGDDVFAEETRAAFSERALCRDEERDGARERRHPHRRQTLVRLIESAAREVVQQHLAAGRAAAQRAPRRKPVECELRVQTTCAGRSLLPVADASTRVDGVTLAL